MRFVSLGRVRAGTEKERIQRRMDWSYPENIDVVGEYWLASDDPKIVTIIETDDLPTAMSVLADWDDVFEFEVFPALTAEEGFELGKKMMAKTKETQKAKKGKEPVTI